MKDLLIIAPERVTFRDLVDHFTDLTRRYDIRLERRGHERRSRAMPTSEERRKHDRRQSDFGERLRKNGWVIVPAAQRHS